MARFKIGDIILIPMVDGKFGIARVLNKLHRGVCVLYELYAMPLMYEEDIDYQEIVKNNPSFIQWGFGQKIKSGHWKVIGNVKVELPIEMPMVVDSMITKDWSIKYFKRKSLYDKPYECEGEWITVDKSEYAKNPHPGMPYPVALKIQYINYLKNMGYVDEIPKDASVFQDVLDF
jgi:hypothetical protein